MALTFRRVCPTFAPMSTNTPGRSRSAAYIALTSLFVPLLSCGARKDRNHELAPRHDAFDSAVRLSGPSQQRDEQTPAVPAYHPPCKP